jgi:hypothetical protein
LVATLEDTLTNVVLTASDVDSTNLTFAILNDPTNGVLSGLNGLLGLLGTNSGAVNYTPNTNYNGPDSFRFTVSDGSLLSTGLVSITVIAVNDAPVANNQDVTTLEDTLTNVVLTATDIDSTNLAYAILTQPTNGVLGELDSDTGSVSYTPDPGYFGNDAFSFRVSDGSLFSTGLVSITILQVNQSPVLPEQPDLTIWAYTTLLVTNAATDDGLPDSGLVYSLTGPGSAGIDANGLITWHAGAGEPLGTNLFTTIVSDGEMSATNRFLVVSLLPPQPVIQSITLTNDRVLITWSAVTGISYALERSESPLDTNWVRLPAGVPADADTASDTDDLIGSSNRFYRVVIP